jgi:hypothetical protein
MPKGLAVITGSATVVHKILENGDAKFGVDVPASASISGSLVLEIPGIAASNYLKSDSVGSASWAAIAASEVTSVPVSNVTSSTVQTAIEELSNDIALIAGASSGSLLLSDGGNNGSIETNGVQTMTITGTVDQITASYSDASDTFTIGFTNDVIVPNNLTVTNDFTVLGTSSFLNVDNVRVEDPLMLLGSGNVGVALDLGLIMERGGANNVGFIYDETADVFALIDTTDDGDTAGNVTIADYLNLHLGSLEADDLSYFRAGLQVTGAVQLPDNSITNDELVNDTFEITASTGLTGGGTGVLGGGLSLSVDFGAGASQAISGTTQLTVNGTTNEVEVAGSPVTLGNPSALTIGLPSDVVITNDLDVGGDFTVTGSTYLGTTSADRTLIESQFRIPKFTTASMPGDLETNSSSYDGYMFYLSASSNPTGEFQTADKWYFNENGQWYKSSFFMQ